MGQSNRRKQPRVRRHHLIAFTHYNGQGALQTQGLGRTLDLSTGGILLETTAPMVPGDRIILEMQIGDQILPLEGVVIHAKMLPNRHHCVGISFQEITKEILAQLQKDLAEGPSPDPSEKADVHQP